jgi:hypothetical protein
MLKHTHKKKIKKIKKHVDSKIIFRARMYGLIFLIMIGFLMYDLIVGVLALHLLIAGFALGIVIGMFASRMFQLTWDHDSQKIIARFDAVGIAILVLYILFSFFRNNLITTVIHGPAVGAVGLAIISGSFLGQLIGMRNGVKGILKAEGITK